MTRQVKSITGRGPRGPPAPKHRDQSLPPRPWRNRKTESAVRAADRLTALQSLNPCRSRKRKFRHHMLSTVSSQAFKACPHHDPAETGHLIDLCASGGRVGRSTLGYFEMGHRYIELSDSVASDSSVASNVIEGTKDFDVRSVLWFIAACLGIDDQVDAITQCDDRAATLAHAISSLL